MLTHLDVHNYTLVDSLDLEFQPGLTTLTGETGAGKSLLLDAIGLATGNKSRGEAILDASRNAEVCATFDLQEQIPTLNWLESNGFPASENNCLLKRIITPQGRSRCFINGRSAPLAQLQDIGRMLISIHGQNEHQALLKAPTQRRLLDHYGRHSNALDTVKKQFLTWQDTEKRLNQAKSFAENNSAHLELLRYQIEELDQLAVEAGEVEALEAEQKRAYHQEELIQRCTDTLTTCSDGDNNLQSQLHQACSSLTQSPTPVTAFSDALELLQSALIHVTEASESLLSWQQQNNNQDCDITTIDSRLSEIYAVARKHKVAPAQLHEHHSDLALELSSIDIDDEKLAALQVALDQALAAYHEQAKKLTNLRERSAKKLGKAITQKLKTLSMASATFCIELDQNEAPTAHGQERPTFLISTIPEKPPAAINKVASGGELSRISLAIQVETADHQTTPTLIFDEVDAGIGGETGDIVGQLLRKLGSTNQTLCVTHLAQVASKAHNHLKVLKVHKGQSVRSEIKSLKGDEIVNEVARMIGGPSGAQTSLNHAREMIANL